MHFQTVVEMLYKDIENTLILSFLTLIEKFEILSHLLKFCGYCRSGPRTNPNFTTYVLMLSFLRNYFSQKYGNKNSSLKMILSRSIEEGST